MRVSQFFLSTLKEAPTEAELVSHQLMLRAGLIKRLAAGLYNWMPLGLRVLRRVEAIVREEMNRAGAIELLMPVVQPAELWQESKRWEKFGPEMLRFLDRHERDFLLGPTHEEVITDIARREIKSYRQLPVNFYQIQTKFRDEVRPRFGVMRAREFTMKDAYSFHTDKASLDETYRVMYDAYSRIFTRLGLKFRAVAADTGAIGGSASHEFHVLAESGEDAIAWCPQSDYAANIELAEALPVAPVGANTPQPLEKTATPKVHTIEEVAAFFKVAPAQTVKTLIVQGENGQLVALLLRGDHALNEVKVEKLEILGGGFRFADESQIRQAAGAGLGSLGPVGLNLPIVADRSVAQMENSIAGANEDGYHYQHVSFSRDISNAQVADLRNVVAGDASPDGKGTLEIARGIEVGHIFQLGDRYTKAMNATYLDENGKAQVMEMGCYGIGVSRVVAAAIEQNFDDRGIIWPQAMAPFQVAIVPIGMDKSEAVRNAAETLYTALREKDIDVLLDDRNERPGVKFADMELIGIPHRITIGDRNLASGQVEYQSRREGNAQLVPVQEIANRLESLLSAPTTA